MLATPAEVSDVKETSALARVAGVFSAGVSLASACAMAYGLRDLVQYRAVSGTSLIAISLIARSLVAWLLEEYTARAELNARSLWHQRSVERLAHSSPGEIHTLDTAIDHISVEPSLAVVRAAAGASLVALALIFFFGGWLCLLIVLALLGISVPAYITAGRATVKSLEDFHRRRSLLVARQLRLLQHITDLRALGAVAFGSDEIAAASDAENRSVLAGIRLAIRSTLVTEFLSGVSIGLVAMVVGLRLWHHEIALGPAFGAVLVTAEMFSALRRYGSEFHRRDDAETARRILSDPAKAAEPISAFLLQLDAVSTAAPAAPVSLILQTCGRIRLVGASGVGKSSLLETAVGLRSPISGTVRRGARTVAFVRTDCHFVTASLRENLSLGESISDDVLREVLESVGLVGDRFADLDESVSEDARDFSTGERIQLAIARALLASPQLLIIDDIASSLDARSRRKIGELLEVKEFAILEAAHDYSILLRIDEEIAVSFP